MHVEVPFGSSVATDGVIAALGCRLPEAEAATLLQVLLMVLFCSIEPLRWEDLGDDRPVQKLLLLLQGFSCRLLLLWGVVVDP
jgi:hypothetical protein